MDQILVAQVIKPILGKYLRSGPEPDWLAKLDGSHLMEHLGYDAS